MIYTPPRGKGVLEKLIDNLLEYLNDDKTYPTDPLLKMCFAHYQFEAIHPFPDGNGRTGLHIKSTVPCPCGIIKSTCTLPI